VDTDVKSLLKDKRLWAGAVVAAAVGVVVFLNRANDATGDAVGGTATGPKGSYVQGTADTTGTDIAAYLGAYQQSNTDLLNAWGQNLTDTIKALENTTPNSPLNPYPPQTWVATAIRRSPGVREPDFSTDPPAPVSRIRRPVIRYPV
jgi:hypothetical protein